MQATEVFYQVLTKKMALAEFEAWIYATPERETTLSADDYVAAISLNYNSSWAFHELQKLLNPYINWGEMRRWELSNVLQTIVHGGKPDDLLAAIIDTFTLLCVGYTFLDEIAHYGLSVGDEFGWDPEKKWEKMTEQQKKHYLVQFYPDVQTQAIHLLNGLTSGIIVIHLSAPEEEMTFTDNRNLLNQKVATSFASDVQRVEQWWELWK